MLIVTDSMERKFRAWFSKKYCVICGERSTCVSRIGLSTCGRHVNSPRDQTRYDWLTGELVTDEYLTVPHWMWQWKAGAANAGSACEVCGDRATRVLFRNGERVGRFCTAHAPKRPFYDPSACVDCGGPSRWLDFDGNERCGEHHHPMPEEGGVARSC